MEQILAQLQISQDLDKKANNILKVQFYVFPISFFILGIFVFFPYLSQPGDAQFVGGIVLVLWMLLL